MIMIGVLKMIKADIDYIIEKLESYKPDNIYDGCNSVREKQDQRVSEVLDSLKAEFESDYENGHTPMPKELIVSLSQTQLEDIKQIFSKKQFDLEPVKNSWIKCSEQEPPTKSFVLVYDGESIFTAYYMKEDGLYYFSADDCIDSEFITYWMPLPEPPEVK